MEYINREDVFSKLDRNKGETKMSKYKVGDKMVVEITEKISIMEEPNYILQDATVVNQSYIDKATEPLSTYTKPLEYKIRRQAAEITRLLAENKELKEDKAVLNAKIDAYELYGDQHEEEYNQAFNQGAEAAWELAKKIVLNNGYSVHDLYEIFDSHDSYHALENYTYQEAAAKVAEWKKAKEEIKIGDIVKIHEGNDNDLCVLYVSTDKKYYNAVDEYGAVYYMLTKEMFTKTGRHIDIDSFLKQIGGEKNE